jgi:hypothetical protein
MRCVSVYIRRLEKPISTMRAIDNKPAYSQDKGNGRGKRLKLRIERMTHLYGPYIAKQRVERIKRCSVLEMEAGWQGRKAGRKQKKL